MVIKNKPIVPVTPITCDGCGFRIGKGFTHTVAYWVVTPVTWVFSSANSQRNSQELFTLCICDACKGELEKGNLPRFLYSKEARRKLQKSILRR